jgi:hypothetical protein
MVAGQAKNAGVPEWKYPRFTGAWIADCLRNGSRRENVAVREMIANAPDKQVLTNSKDVEVSSLFDSSMVGTQPAQ